LEKHKNQSPANQQEGILTAEANASIDTNKVRLYHSVCCWAIEEEMQSTSHHVDHHDASDDTGAAFVILFVDHVSCSLLLVWKDRMIISSID
jgi:hypothetical protein